jgi:ankyrin repeat protein
MASTSLPFPLVAKCISHAGCACAPLDKSWALALDHLKHDPIMLAEWLVQRFGDNALVKAVRLNEAVFVEAMVKAGADIHAGYDGFLRMAAYEGHAIALDALIRAGANAHNPEALYMCASYGRTEAVAVLLNAGVYPRHGALMQAARFGHAGVAKVLLDAGADVHKNNDDALDTAVCGNNIDVVKVLLDAGADVRANNDIVIKTAAWRCCTKLVQILLDAGADVHADNDAPLKLAVKRGSVEDVSIVLALLNAGADASVCDDNDEKAVEMLAIARAYMV